MLWSKTYDIELSSWNEWHRRELERFKRLIQFFIDNPDLDRENDFLSSTLMPFYDAMHDGLSGVVGHLVYRLSDRLPADKRKLIAIYPSEDGSLVWNGTNWDSLEDWRTEWEKLNHDIPEIQKLRLPPGCEDMIAQITGPK